MKRITLFLLGIVLMSTVACGRTNSNANSDRVTAAEDSKAKVIHLTKAEFLEKVYNFEKNHDEWKYEGDKPAIVDFYATWCGPCKMVAPILDELAKEYDGQIVIYKVDTDKETELARFRYPQYSFHSVYTDERKAGNGTGSSSQRSF